MAKNDKLNKERKTLKNGTLIYTLEIAVNPEEGTVEYIVEGLEEISDDSASGPINTADYPTILEIDASIQTSESGFPCYAPSQNSKCHLCL